MSSPWILDFSFLSILPEQTRKAGVSLQWNQLEDDQSMLNQWKGCQYLARCFEVVTEAVTALGEIGNDDRALECLVKMKEHHFWQVRNAALRALGRLLERGVVMASPSLLSQINSFVLTATDFRPHFSIKETYRTLQRSYNERLGAEREAVNPGPFAEHTLRKRSG